MNYIGIIRIHKNYGAAVALKKFSYAWLVKNSS